MTKVLQAILLVLVMMGISYEISAKELEREDLPRNIPFHVICATLAFNAGYEAEGQKHADLVDPFYQENKQVIMSISHAVVADLGEEAMELERTLPFVARKAYSQYCEENL